MHIKAVIHGAGNRAVPCRAQVTAPLRFAYDPLSGAGRFSTAIVTLICEPAQFLASIAISPGNANWSARYREMWKNGTDSSHVLAYNLYTADDYLAVWGDGTAGTSIQSINQTVTTFDAVLFAKLQYPQNDAAAGVYSDTVTVTFNL